MKKILIVLIVLSVVACGENSADDNFHIQLAKEYGVHEMIDYGPDLDQIDEKEWVEFLDKVVKMKEANAFYKNQYEERMKIHDAYFKELENVSSEAERKIIHEKYAEKYDWIQGSTPERGEPRR